MPRGLVGEPTYDYTGPFGTIQTAPLTLSAGEVCRECNSDLGLLDDELQEQLGILRVFWNRGLTRSGGQISINRPGFFAIRQNDAVTMHASLDGAPYRTDAGQLVPAVRGKRNAISVEAITKNELAGFRVTQPIELNKRVVRALHKVAFELVCLQHGFNQVLHSSFNPLRDYILWGRGHRTVGVEHSEVLTQPDGLPIQPRLELSPVGSSGWNVRILLGQWVNVWVGAHPIETWSGMITVAPNLGPTILRLSFDITGTDPT